LLLLFHFILAILLLLHVLLQLGYYLVPGKNKTRLEIILNPAIWRRIVAFLLTLSILGLVVADIVIWSQGHSAAKDDNATFRPDVLGYL
jgi:hypothetical protein